MTFNSLCRSFYHQTVDCEAYLVPRHRHKSLPDTQIVQIRPRESWLSLDLRELWAFRELLYFLVWRDIKIRYKQTIFGVGWAVLQPVVTTAIFTIIFSRWAGFDTGDVPYPLFALSGLLLWQFTNSAISIASGSLINNVHLVTKIYFPRLLVPLAATMASLFDLIFSGAILVTLMVYYGKVPTVQILFAPVVIGLAILQAAAFGTMLSALAVKYRDIKFVLPFVLQIWMVASPVFYPASIMPERWQLLFALNPLTGVMEGFRSSLFGTPPNWPVIGISALSIVIIAVLALIVFKRMEDDFADVI